MPLGKPCGPTRVDLVGGLAGGTFYIRARLRAGACVLAVGETVGHFDPARWPCGWPCGLSPWQSGFGWVWAANQREGVAIGRRPTATRPTSGVGEGPKLAGQTGGNGGKPAIF